MDIPSITFNVDQAQAAGDAWRFNCGPGALCAVLQVAPEEIRPHLGDFENKGYLNPMLMYQILHGLGLKYKNQRLDSVTCPKPEWPEFGLIRIQWDGPWCAEGVPMKARYRHTHWVAVFKQLVFDVNATCVGGWLPYTEWADQLVPWLLKQCEPKANGKWWPTHCLALDRDQCLDVGRTMRKAA